MIDITLHQNHNSYVVWVTGSIKHNGERSFKSTELTQMLEFIGLITLETKIKVTEN